METYIYWFLITLAAVFVGMGKGGLPVIATLGVPSLSLIMSPITAAGLLLPVYIVSDIFALSAYRRDFSWPVLKIGMVGMTFGVVIGGLTASYVIEWVVTLLIGLMGFLFALDQLLKKRKSLQKKNAQINSTKGYFWCTIAGFTSFISHTGGPPWQIFTIPLGLAKSVFVGTSVILFSYCNVIKLIPYIWLGQIDTSSFKISLVMMIPATIAVYIGVNLVKLIPEATFFKIVTWALFSISIKLIWDGIRIPLGA
ncbi:MAG: sulfite exporter TauE/SafE family protein [Paracoccaceae bacterium]